MWLRHDILWSQPQTAFLNSGLYWLWCFWLVYLVFVLLSSCFVNLNKEHMLRHTCYVLSVKNKMFLVRCIIHYSLCHLNVSPTHLLCILFRLVQICESQNSRIWILRFWGVYIKYCFFWDQTPLASLSSFLHPSDSVFSVKQMSVKHAAASGIVAKFHCVFKNRTGSHTAAYLALEEDEEGGSWAKAHFMLKISSELNWPNPQLEFKGAKYDTLVFDDMSELCCLSLVLVFFSS